MSEITGLLRFENEDEFRETISSCIRDDSRQAINNIEVLDVEKWKSGSNATIYRLPLRVTFPSNRELLGFVIKQYNDAQNKRKDIERGIAAITNHIPVKKYEFAMGREIKIFPKLLFDNEHKLYDRGLSLWTEETLPGLESRLEEKKQISWELIASKALEPYILLFDYAVPFARYDLHISDPFEKSNVPIPGAEYFTNKFKNALETIANVKNAQIDLSKMLPGFYKLAAKHLSCEDNKPEENRTFVQEQAYPSHNNLFSLIDASEVIVGGRVLSLGSLYLDAAMEKLDRKNEELIKSVYEGYTLRRDELNRHEKHLSSFSMGESEFATGMLLAGAYSNILRSAEFLKRADNVQEEIMKKNSEKYLSCATSHIETMLKSDIGTREDIEGMQRVCFEFKSLNGGNNK